MLAFYDNQPTKLEAVGNGSFLYRYDIQEVEKTSQGSSEDGTEEVQTGTQWQCQEVTVWAPLTSNKITAAVISDRWDNDYEQKLVNEYNAAVLGLLSEEEATARKEAYTAFLTERSALKTQVDADCAELGVK